MCTQVISKPSAMGTSLRKTDKSLIPLPKAKALYREGAPLHSPPHSISWAETTACLGGISWKTCNLEPEDLRLSQTYLL